MTTSLSSYDTTQLRYKSRFPSFLAPRSFFYPALLVTKIAKEKLFHGNQVSNQLKVQAQSAARVANTMSIVVCLVKHDRRIHICFRETHAS